MLLFSWFLQFKLTQLWLNVSYRPLNPLAGFALGPIVILFYIALMFIFMLPNLLNIDSAKVSYLWHFAVAFIYAMMLFHRVLFPLGKSSADLLLYSIVVALVGNLFFEIVYLFVIPCFLVFGPIIVERWYAARYPVAVLISNLIDVLDSVQSSGNCRVTLKDKQKQLAGLEIAARCVEYALPQQLRSGDVATDIWLKEVTQEIASALREKKRWILTPKEDTYDYLTKSIVSTLIYIINGNWDALERIKSEELAHPHLWRLHILYAVGLFIEAMLPILAFAIIQNFFSLSITIREYVIVGLFIWILIIFVSALDPKFHDKIAVIKDVISLYPSKDHML